jgi:hypothetical protein
MAPAGPETEQRDMGALDLDRPFTTFTSSNAAIAPEVDGGRSNSASLKPFSSGREGDLVFTIKRTDVSLPMQSSSPQPLDQNSTSAPPSKSVKQELDLESACVVSDVAPLGPQTSLSPGHATAAEQRNDNSTPGGTQDAETRHLLHELPVIETTASGRPYKEWHGKIAFGGRDRT